MCSNCVLLHFCVLPCRHLFSGLTVLYKCDCRSHKVSRKALVIPARFCLSNSPETVTFSSSWSCRYYIRSTSAYPACCSLNVRQLNCGVLVVSFLFLCFLLAAVRIYLSVNSLCLRASRSFQSSSVSCSLWVSFVDLSTNVLITPFSCAG